MEKIAKNQSWKQDNTQCCRQIEEVLEEVCALSTKMDTLLNWLDQRANFKKDHRAIQDAFDAQTRCEEYLGMEILENQEDINIINNSSMLQKQRWNQKQQTTYPAKYLGNFNNSSNFKQPPLQNLILEQARINDTIVKKLASNDKNSRGYKY
jgi:hypothetical protein